MTIQSACYPPLGSHPPRSGPERSDFVLWRNGRLQPKSAFSRLPPVHGGDLEGQLRVELTSSPSRQRMAGFLRQADIGFPGASCSEPPIDLDQLRSAGRVLRRARESVSAPGFAADAVMEEEKALGIRTT
jgi:hypothetical protein